MFVIKRDTADTQKDDKGNVMKQTKKKKMMKTNKSIIENFFCINKKEY